MICKPCQESIDLRIYGEMAHKSHGCKGGTHCDCQHRPAPSARWIQPASQAEKVDQDG